MKLLEQRMITGFESLMGELKAFREEMTIFPYQLARQTNAVDDHENRIVKMETTIFAVAK